MNHTLEESMIFSAEGLTYLKLQNVKDLATFMKYVVAATNRSGLGSAAGVQGETVDAWIRQANLMLQTDIPPSLIMKLASIGLDHETILARTGDKIAVIKEIRAIPDVDLGLKETKEMVDLISGLPLPAIDKTVIVAKPSEPVATTTPKKTIQGAKSGRQVSVDTALNIKKEPTVTQQDVGTEPVAERAVRTSSSVKMPASKIELNKEKVERTVDLRVNIRGKKYFTKFLDPTEKADHTLKPIENVQFEVREPLNTIQTTDGRKIYLPDVNKMDLELMIMETEVKLLRQQPRSDGSTSPMEALLYALMAEKEHRDDADYNEHSRTEDLIREVYTYVETYNRYIPDPKDDPEINKASRDQIKDSLQRTLRELAYRGYFVLADSEFDDDETNNISVFNNPSTEFFDELKNAIGEVNIADEFLIERIEGRIVYKRPGTNWPLRNATVSITWVGPTCTQEDRVETDQNGDFYCPIPTTLVISKITLTITKSESSQVFSLDMGEVREKKGDLGTMIVKSEFGAHEGLLETLDNLTDDLNSITDRVTREEIEESTQRSPKITFGNGDTEFILEADTSPSKFTYKILHRLVEPNLAKNEGGKISTYKRQAIENPINLSAFRETSSKDPLAQPLMSSLGIGYILTMQQDWKPKGFFLGDMLYSIALAPGEEQRIVMSEKSEMYQIADVESLSDMESESYRSTQNNSLESLFTSSLLESINGSTHMESKTKSSGTGLIASLFAASNTTTHSASSHSQQTSRRNETSVMAESFNEKISRMAKNQRASRRTGIRTASSNESTGITSKIIANHNHSHALTMQYWEVIRDYSISTHIADVSLVCYIPFQPIQFLPDGEKHILDFNDMSTKAKDGKGNVDPNEVRKLIDTRYSPLMKHYDAIYRYMPYKYRRGLSILKKYSTYPIWEFSSGTTSPTRLKLFLTGGFLPIHDVHAALRLKNGRSIKARPVLTSMGENRRFPNKSELVAELTAAKEQIEQNLIFDIDVPSGILEDDYHSIEYYFSYSKTVCFRRTEELYHAQRISFDFDPNLIKLTPAEMAQIGAPTVNSVILSKPGRSTSYVYSTGHRVLNGRRSNKIHNITPIMTYEELQEIESTFQHVLENTIRYSQAVWSGLGAEERAMILERFTIAVPRSGGTDIGANVPLMDCVTNQILGFYGNCMIMPFAYPAEMANVLGTSSKELQDALYSYHTKAFRIRDTTISLGTDGMIGEAILGKSNSSEKIDITRFWNWKDSPITHATEISSNDLDKSSILSGKDAPSDLVNVSGEFTLDDIAVTKIPQLIQYLAAEKRASNDLTNSKNVATHMTKIAEANANERINTMNATADLANSTLEIVAGVVSSEKEEQKKKEEEQKKTPETKEAEQNIKKTKQESDVLTEQLNKAKIEAELAAQQLKKAQQDEQLAKVAKGESTAEQATDSKGKGKGKESGTEEPSDAKDSEADKSKKEGS